MFTSYVGIYPTKHVLVDDTPLDAHPIKHMDIPPQVCIPPGMYRDSETFACLSWKFQVEDVRTRCPNITHRRTRDPNITRELVIASFEENFNFTAEVFFCVVF